MKKITFFESEVGKIKLTSDEHSLLECNFVETINEDEVLEENELLSKAKKELGDYFLGKRTTFDIPLDIKGTKYQKIVWNKILEIPYGEIKTYKEIGEEVKKELGLKNISYRAIGKAVGSNKLLIFIPCHRVVYKDKSKKEMYKAGLEIKKYLLDLESSR